jgi:hypothetical protein
MCCVRRYKNIIEQFTNMQQDALYKENSDNLVLVT